VLKTQTRGKRRFMQKVALLVLACSNSDGAEIDNMHAISYIATGKSGAH